MESRQFARIALAGLLLAAVRRPPPRIGTRTIPNRPVTLVVPYAAGGGLDVFARQLAQRLSERLGKTFVVENRPGAGTVIGATYVAKAAPDGYTIMLGTDAVRDQRHAEQELPYDPAKDFAPIIHTSNAPFLLLVHPRRAGQVGRRVDQIGQSRSRSRRLTARPVRARRSTSAWSCSRP